VNFVTEICVIGAHLLHIVCVERMLVTYMWL